MKNVTKKNGIARKYWSMVFLLAPVLTAHADTSGFKTGLQTALGVGAFIAFASCVFFIFEGIYQYRQGGNYGKDIVGLIISAGAFAIVSALFSAFSLSGASLTPSF